MLSDGLLNNLVYDANGLVSWDSGTRYFYDPMGQRVGKAGFTSTDTVYFGGRALARLTNGAWTDLVYGVDGGLLAEVPGTQNGAPVYRMTDHLGSSVGLLSASGTVMGAQETVPFGQLLPGGGAQETLVPFAGLEHDPKSGLDHATYRQYAAAAGRWMSPDPYDGSMDLANPQSLNRYAYVMNSPLGFTDPSGLDGRSGLGHVGGGNSCVSAVLSGGHDVAGDIFCAVEVFKDIESLFSHPKFHGSTTPRPNAHIWDEHEFTYGANGGGALGLPGSGCEFGACGGGPSDFTGNNPLAVGGPIIISPTWVYSLINLFHFPYADASDPNHRLGGTHYCGPGGGGGTTGGLDGLCAAHDACYRRSGVSAIDNLNPFTSGAAMGGCDRLLCASLSQYSPASRQEGVLRGQIQQVFGCGYINK